MTPGLWAGLHQSRHGDGHPRPADLSWIAMANSPGSPWQNGIAERLIGTLRRECLNHMVIFGEAHRRRILSAYAVYYNQTRMHLALNKDCPLERPIQRFGSVAAIPVLAGLHHQYLRI